MQDDETWSIPSGPRWVRRYLYRVIAPGILKPPIESQSAEARVAELARRTEAGVLNDGHETGTEKAHALAQRERSRER